MNKVIVYNNYFKDEILKVIDCTTIEAVPFIEQAIRSGLDVLFIHENSISTED